jgi:hypothetical protein
LDLSIDDRTFERLHEDVVNKLGLTLFEDDQWFVEVVENVFEVIFTFLNFADLVEDVIFQANVLLVEPQVPCGCHANGHRNYAHSEPVKRRRPEH